MSSLNLWVISGMATRRVSAETIENTHEGFYALAHSRDEAVGIGYKLIHDLLPQQNGWSSHSVGAKIVPKEVYARLWPQP